MKVCKRRTKCTNCGTPADKLATLQRRADYLRDVIATQGGVSWDKAELSALKWAIEQLTKCLNEGRKD